MSTLAALTIAESADLRYNARIVLSGLADCCDAESSEYVVAAGLVLALDALTAAEIERDEALGKVTHLSSPEDVWTLLLGMNDRGETPEIAGVDALGRPVLLWLDEEGGDDMSPMAVVLGGPVAEVSVPVPVEWPEVAYPVRALAGEA